jgi:hypothetical protein
MKIMKNILYERHKLVIGNLHILSMYSFPLKIWQIIERGNVPLFLSSSSVANHPVGNGKSPFPIYINSDNV